MHLTAGLVIYLLVVLAAAYAWETYKWRSRPTSDFEGMVTGDDWKRWTSGLKELRRRGENIERYVPVFLSRMLADSRLRREAARTSVSDVFPGLRPELRAYHSSDSPDVSRQKLAPLLGRYPAADVAAADSPIFDR